ncbi:MAG: DMT family transporter, partial [Fimbriimonadaceae bacterium]|nr:DMT family transporter [Alphaproteobacteria bacterium]
LLISTSFTIGAAITHAMDPVPLTFLRFLLATILFAVIVTASEGWRRPSFSDLARYSSIGLLLVIYFVSMFEALRWSGPVSLGTIFTLVPLMTALISLHLVKQPINRTMGVGLAIGALGAIWVVFGGSLEKLLGFAIGKGELIFFVGAIAHSIYSPAIRKLHRGESVIVLTFWTLFCGTVILGLYGFKPIMETDWATQPLKIYGGITYLAVATTAASFFLIKYASIRLPSAKVMAYTYLIPAFVVFQLTILGADWPSISVLAGIAVITAATIVLQRS